MTFQYLKVQQAAHGVAHVQMVRPPVNAADETMYRELAALFSHPDGIVDDLRAIVLSGEGKHFCGGNDLSEFATMTPENGVERMWRVRSAFFAISDCRVPVVGAVHGVALGTGLAIAASCDFVVCEPDARFGLPELTVGVMGGARHLARLAPQPLVRRMYFTGEQMTGRDFAAAGGCVFVSPEGQHVQEATRLATRIASFSPTALGVAKHVLDRIETMSLKAGYEFEQGATVRMSGHPDSKEALNAFREARPPHYLPRDLSSRWFL